MFLTEKHLVQVLKENFSTMCDWKMQDKNTFLSEEVDLGFGVADLVISKIKDMSYPNVVLNTTDVNLYNTIKDNSDICFEDILSSTHINAKIVRQSLDRLVQHRFVTVCEFKYNICLQYEGITHKNIAIEAKLKNWQRALSQAFRYKWFASEAYVVMDSCHIHSAVKRIDEFKKLNVGLAEININGVMIMHHKPAEEIPYNARMTMTLNERVKESLLTSQI